MSDQKGGGCGWVVLLAVLGVGVFWYLMPKQFQGVVNAILAAVGKEDPEVARKRRDEEFKSTLIGTWVADIHYKPGYKIGDGGVREVEVWTFNPDGTFNSYGANNGSDLASAFLTVLGMNTQGKWHIYDGQLMTEVTGSSNPFISKLGSGKPHPRGTGKIRVDSKSQFWLEGVPFYRKQ